MSIVSIRTAQPGDTEALIDLATRFYKTDGYHVDASKLPQRLEAARRSDQTAIFVADHEAEGCIGFIAVLLSQGLEHGCKAEVEALFVRSAVRGQRIGTRLIETGIEWATAQGAEEVYLVIAAQGEPVRQLEQLYLGLGFEPSRRVLMHRDF
ncbi:MAG: GNAT family N-acetyltransferase [Pseudomonadota bacterium]